MTFEDKNKHFANIIVALATAVSAADTYKSFEYVDCQASVKEIRNKNFHNCTTHIF